MLAGAWRVRVLTPEDAMKPTLMLLSAVALAIVAAAPATAGPNPNPVAPAHTGTACVNVLSHNPQAGEGSHSAPAAQANFAEVGAAACGERRAGVARSTRRCGAETLVRDATKTAAIPPATARDPPSLHHRGLTGSW